jgi:hypothetical protein
MRTVSGLRAMVEPLCDWSECHAGDVCGLCMLIVDCCGSAGVLPHEASLPSQFFLLQASSLVCNSTDYRALVVCDHMLQSQCVVATNITLA